MQKGERAKSSACDSTTQIGAEIEMSSQFRRHSLPQTTIAPELKRRRQSIRSSSANGALERRFLSGTFCTSELQLRMSRWGPQSDAINHRWSVTVVTYPRDSPVVTPANERPRLPQLAVVDRPSHSRCLTEARLCPATVMITPQVWKSPPSEVRTAATSNRDYGMYRSKVVL
jgi:hypothetical protein